MKKLVFIALILIGLSLLSLHVLAKDTTNVYSEDGRMATIPVSQLDQWKSVGWQESFPYCGKEVWATNMYLRLNAEDIYGIKMNNLLTIPNSYNKIIIKWYDDTQWTQINEYEKSLKTLIFEYNGGEFKMSYGDFLRGRASYQNVTHLYWQNPQTYYKISNANWEKIQGGWIWVGMTESEFLLSMMRRPDRINTSVGIWGSHEQWVYEYSYSSNSYYYFSNGVLSSWQN